MRFLWPVLFAISCLLTRAGFAQDTLPQPLRQAQAALDAGRNAEALTLALRYTDHQYRDPSGWIVLGRAYLLSDLPHARAAAIRAFTQATQLAPDRAEAWDWLARAGLELSSSDGEWYVLTGSEKTLGLDPMYPGAWERWRGVYRNAAARERMLGLLSAHRDIPEVRARIARILIESERYADANTELDALVALEPDNPEWLALRAQSAFESGDSSAGFGPYMRAISHADRDTTGLLWQQVVGVATPNEIRQWEAGIPPAQRPGWFRSFWARRNPDLFAGINRRVAEHFARLHEARKMFSSTFPLADYKNRVTPRAMALRPTQGEQLFYQRCEVLEVPGGPAVFAAQARRGSVGLYPTSVFDQWKYGTVTPGDISQEFFAPKPYELPDLPYSRDLRDVDTTAAGMGYNERTGLDDRGVTFLRFGAPRHRVIGSTNTGDPFCQLPDLERWVYDDIGTIRFFRPEVVNVGMRSGWRSTGEQVFRPMTPRQFEAMDAALTMNATSVPAPLSFGVWTAVFAGSDSSLLDLVVVTTRGAVAAQLASAAEAGPTGRDSSGVVVLQTKPGRYALDVNAMVADTLGRQSLGIALRPLGGGPGVSDLLLAPAWPDTAVTREAMLGRLQRDLTFGPGTSLRAYGEVYGLRPGSDGHVRYRASYQIYPTHRLAEDAAEEELPGGVRHTFDRVRPSRGGPIAEWLDIAPEQLPAGRYLLRLEIMEPRRLEVIGRAQIGFEIRSR